MIKIKSLHHIAIICSNYEDSKKFYVNVLGFEVLNETYRAERDSYKLDLRLNHDYLLELFSFPNPPKRVSYPEACGLRHLAFAVEDLDLTYQMLLEKNINVEAIRVDEITQKRFFFCFDPDALPIEFYTL